MSAGTGIFLGLVALSLVLLFRMTRETWRWRRIVLYSSGGILGLIAATAIGVWAFGTWREWPRPLTELDGVSLGMSRQDVRFFKGAPWEADEKPQWVYSRFSESHRDALVITTVMFSGEKVDAVVVKAIYSDDLWIPYGLPSGSGVVAVEAKLGPAVEQESSPDGAVRLLRYPKLNLTIGFESNSLKMIGIRADQKKLGLDHAK